MIRRPPRSTLDRSSAASDVYKRQVELYAESNQIGLIARMETDGMPVLAEAFVRVKLAAS